MKVFVRSLLFFMLLAGALVFTYIGPPRYTSVVTQTPVYREYIRPFFDRIFSAVNNGALVIGQAVESQNEVSYRSQEELSFLPLREGQRLMGRTTVSTGESSGAVVELVDLSKITIGPNSTVVLDIPDNATDLSSLTLTVEKGSAEALKAADSKTDIKIKNEDGTLTELEAGKAARMAKEKADKAKELAAQKAAEEEAERQRLAAEEEATRLAQEEEARKLAEAEAAAKLGEAGALEKLYGSQEGQRLAAMFPEEREAILKFRQDNLAQQVGAEESKKLLGMSFDERQAYLAQEAARLRKELGDKRFKELRSYNFDESYAILRKRFLKEGKDAAEAERLARLGAFAILNGASGNFEYMLGSREALRIRAFDKARTQKILARHYQELQRYFGDDDTKDLWASRYGERVAGLTGRNQAVETRAGKAEAKRLQVMPFDAKVTDLYDTQQALKARVGDEEFSKLVAAPFDERFAALSALYGKKMAPAAAEKAARKDAIALEAFYPPSRLALNLSYGRAPASMVEKYLRPIPPQDFGPVEEVIEARQKPLSTNWAKPNEELVLSNAIYNQRMGNKAESRELMTRAAVSEVYSTNNGKLNDASQVALEGIFDGYLETNNCRLAQDTLGNIESFFSEDPATKNYAEALKSKIGRSPCSNVPVSNGTR